MIGVDLTDDRIRYEMNFGERLNTLRENAGMTYKSLSDRAGISKATLWYYISGKVEPTAYVIYRLAKALDVSGDEILGLGGRYGD